MNQKFINSEKLSRAVKEFLCDLIEKGKDFVEITEFNAGLQKIINRIPGEVAIEWNDVEKVGRPLVSDEYLVMIAYVDKPTVLHYDAEEQVFFCEVEDETVLYKVTHWAEMPMGPNEK